MNPITPPEPSCRWCGCEHAVHEHYRAGTECGRHGREGCRGWDDGRGWWARLLRLLGR